MVSRFRHLAMVWRCTPSRRASALFEIEGSVAWISRVLTINDYIQRADPWPCKYRIILAEKIEQTYDRYGWGRPGLRSYQKKRQKAKKIKELDRLRNYDS